MGRRPAAPPPPETIFQFPAGAKAGRRPLPRRLQFHGLINFGCLDLREMDGRQWPDDETHLAVEWWNIHAAPVVEAIFLGDERVWHVDEEAGELAEVPPAEDPDERPGDPDEAPAAFSKSEIPGTACGSAVAGRNPKGEVREMHPTHIDPANPPAEGTLYDFPAGAKAGRRPLPRQLRFRAIVGDACVAMEKPDGPPWPDDQTHLSVEFWNQHVAPRVNAVLLGDQVLWSWSSGVAEIEPVADAAPPPPEDPEELPGDPDEAPAASGKSKTPPAHAPPAAAVDRRRAPEVVLRLVRIADLDRSANFRAAGPDEQLPLLTGSMLDLGLLQPVVVRQVGEVLRLVAGHRRVAAALAAGEEMIEAKVYSGADEKWEAAARLAENVQRKELSHIELAAVLGAARQAGMTVAQIAEQSHLSDDSVRRHLALLRLFDPVARLVASGRLPIHHAELIARVGDPAKQMELAGQCLELRWDAKRGAWKDRTSFGPDRGAPRDYLQPMDDLRDEVGRALQGLAAGGWLKLEEPSDSTGVAGKRRCEGCPDNTATLADQAGLFAGILPRDADGKGHCTNAACYEAKAKAMAKVAQQRERDKAREKKAAVARAKKAGLHVCEDCERIAQPGEQFDRCAAAGNKRLCPKCAGKVAKGGRQKGETCEAQRKRVNELKAKFPSTTEQRFAVALHGYGCAVAKAIGRSLAKGGCPGAEAVLWRLAIDRQNSLWFDEGDRKKVEPMAAVLKAGRLTGKALTMLWRDLDRSDQCVPAVDYDGQVREVPLETGHVAYIDVLEQIAGRWKLALPARPVEGPGEDGAADFPDEAGADADSTQSVEAKKLLTTIIEAARATSLAALARCTDLRALEAMVDFHPGDRDPLKGDWRRAAVWKRIKELRKAARMMSGAVAAEDRAILDAIGAGGAAKKPLDSARGKALRQAQGKPLRQALPFGKPAQGKPSAAGGAKRKPKTKGKKGHRAKR